VLDFVVALTANLAECFADDLFELFGVGQLELKRHGEPADAVRQRRQIDEHDSHVVARVQIAKLASDNWVAAMGAQILEEIHGAHATLLDDVLECGGRLASFDLGLGDKGSRLLQPLGDGPLIQRQIQRIGGLANKTTRTLLVVRFDREDRVAGLDQQFELVEHRDATRRSFFRPSPGPSLRGRGVSITGSARGTASR
jgi:hypothetical protein